MSTTPAADAPRRLAAMRAVSAPALIAAIPTAVALVGAMRFPFTASPGAAGAQLLAVVGGLSLACAMAVRGAARHADGFRRDVVWGATAALLLTAGWAIVGLASEAMRPACGSSKGLVPFVIIAVPVLLLQGAVGAWIGWLTGRTRRAVAMLVAFELLALLALGAGFYFDPAWRVMSHLFVALITEQMWGSAAPEGVESFRAATCLFAIALGAFGVALFPGARHAAVVRPRRAWIAGAVLLTLGLLVDRAARPVVAPTHAALARAYSLTRSRGPLVLHADPLAVRIADLDVLLAEGTLWLGRIEARLGQRPRQPIHVWVHATRSDKQRWTGASLADFALPWRHEIHVRLGGAQHPTLGHELVHVIAGEPLSTLFGTPGRFVVMQRPALVEGLAVAVAHELKHSDDLTVIEETAALTRLHRAPDPERLFSGIAFLGEAHQKAYAAAGAALQALSMRAQDSGATLRRVYAAASIEGALGPDASRSFFGAYRTLLDTLTLPPGALSDVDGAFGAPSIVGGTCGGSTDERGPTARRLARSGAVGAALTALGPSPSAATLEAIERDVRTVGDTAGFAPLARALAAAGDSLTAARRLLSAGDLYWLADSVRAANGAWAQVPITLATVPLARAVRVRQLLGAVGSAAAPGSIDARIARTALAMLLRPSWLGSSPEAAVLLRLLDSADARSDVRTSLDARRVHSMARYLLARRHALAGRLDAAEPMLARVQGEQVLDAPFLEETLILRVRALAGAGRAAEAAALLARTPLTGVRRVFAMTVSDLLERAQRAALAPHRPRNLDEAAAPAWADAQLLMPFDPSP